MTTEVAGKDMTDLFETIIREVPAPTGDLDGPAQVLFSNIDYDEYVGRVGIGRVERGKIKSGMNLVLCRRDGETKNVKISKLYQFEGLNGLRQRRRNWGISSQFPDCRSEYRRNGLRPGVYRATAIY